VNQRTRNLRLAILLGVAAFAAYGAFVLSRLLELD
jgi:hypothetical protein